MDVKLRLPALRIRQGPSRIIYQFAVDGKMIDQFASVSRIRRGESQEVAGYQRPEALAHIASIRRYIESPDAMLPNSLVIAFDERVVFEELGPEAEGVCHGWISIPVDDSLEAHERPGFIVDGQQRSAAIRDARVERFPVAVTAFITNDEEEHRGQFILVNSVKPLSQSLIFELLPTTTARLPRRLAQKRLATVLLEFLNYEPWSPLNRLIKTPTNPEGIVKDNSVIRMLENSIQDGALYAYRDAATGMGDVDSMVAVVANFWSAVEVTFPDDWGQPPRRSRLMHGVGVVALGSLMDEIVRDLALDAVPTVEHFAARLMLIRAECHWSSGLWDMGPHGKRAWNDIENTTRDVQLLKDHLLGRYREVAPRRARMKQSSPSV